MFAATSAAQNTEDFLGDLACALEPRWLASENRSDGAGPHQRLLFALGALAPAERTLLAKDARIERVGEDLARLTIHPETLADRARDLPAARCLDTAMRAALRPRARPELMGIVNVTPDSFSDGGRFQGAEPACEQARRLAREGADWIDVGGESTRPGSEPVPLALELERVLPVISELGRARAPKLSIDTRKLEVARAALDAGARAINDVSAGRDAPEILALAAERRAGLILMHAQGTPKVMQQAPHYRDVVREVAAFLRARAAAAWRAGVAPGHIALDPGLGFGKTVEHNLALVRALPELRSLGFPICLGLSRKSFLGALSGGTVPEERGSETLAGVTLAAWLGADLQRVHEVGPAKKALAIATALLADRAP